MSEADRNRRAAQLRAAHEQGILDDDTFQTMMAALEEAPMQAETDSGAIAQGEGATTVGERGVNVGGNVSGDIITGNVYHGPQTDDPKEALRIYRMVLAAGSGALPLRGVDIGASDPTGGQNPLGLANVYVDLNTTTQVKNENKKEDAGPFALREGKETRPLPALEAVAANRRMVLLGDPGSGKSTFVNHLAHCLASHALDPEGGWLTRHLPDWPQADADCVPIVIVLRDWAAGLPKKLPAPTPQHLWEFIQARLKQQNLAFAAPALREALEAGRALVLLDGLDEVPTAAQRVFVREAILAFKGRYEADGRWRNRYLVTSRILSYQNPDLRLPESQFPDFELALFNEGQIEQFIAAWYAELVHLGSVDAGKQAALTRQLQQAVQRPDLRRMAPTPLLLTIMALVHAHKGRLPDARALLYEDTVDMLLWRWEQVKLSGGDEQPALRQLLLDAERTEVDLKSVLGELAYDAHAQVGAADGAEQLADVGELKLLKALAALNNGDMGWAQQALRVMKVRAGLLVERLPELFTFPHRTFQEYLAGAHLAMRPDFVQRAAALAGENAHWRVVVLLAAGHLVYVLRDPYKPLNLAAELCPLEAADDTDPAWQQAWLAGDVLLEMGVRRVGDSGLGRELLERVRQRLAALVTGGKLTPRERVEAGDTLGRLGDPRPGVCTLEPELMPVPAGPFLMGEEKHEIEIAQPFGIARYPVTNAQYQMFIDDGGYTEKWRRCWTDAGWQWKRDRSGPSDIDGFLLPNQPRVGVTWYEAVAYARWLAKTTGKPYRLPTEAEWERAARHTDGRPYPWGEEWRDGMANTKEAGLERTSAVGIFPVDTAVCGAQDFGGNVWEWCQTRWNDEQGKEYSLPYREDDGRENAEGGNSIGRLLKGGVFWDGNNRSRCSARNVDGPNLDSDDYGFRVLLSPLFDSDL